MQTNVKKMAGRVIYNYDDESYTTDPRDINRIEDPRDINRIEDVDNIDNREFLSRALGLGRQSRGEELHRRLQEIEKTVQENLCIQQLKKEAEDAETKRVDTNLKEMCQRLAEDPSIQIMFIGFNFDTFKDKGEN